MGTMNYRLEGMDVPRGRLCFLQNIQPWALQQVFKRPRPCFYQTKCSHSSLSTAQILSLATVTAALVLNPASCSAKGVLATNTILRRYVVTDPEAILRYALPIPSERVSTDQIPIRRVQELLERLGVDLRARGAAGLISGRRDLAKLREILLTQRLDVLLDVPAKKRQRAAEFLSKLEACLTDIQGELGLAYTPRDSGVFPPQIMEMQQTLSDVFTARNSAAKQFNFEAATVESFRRQALECVAEIEQLSVEGTGLPYRIPRRYNNFPRLVGRATVEISVLKMKDREWKDPESGSPIGKEVRLSAVLDGYSAPLTAGNFIDIARRGYYNNTRVLASQKNFYAQLGEREDDNFDGFKDPTSGTRRQIPLEILVDGEELPNYGATLDELGIADLQPILPVSAYGAMAMVHSVENPNDASSQFYFFMLDPTSYQARSFGGSALTGSLSTFGYIENGREFLSQLEAGDTVSSVRVISGEENFVVSGDR